MVDIGLVAEYFAMFHPEGMTHKRVELRADEGGLNGSGILRHAYFLFLAVRDVADVPFAGCGVERSCCLRCWAR